MYYKMLKNPVTRFHGYDDEIMDKIKNIIKHSEISEKSIERYLRTAVRERGGICLKYSNPGDVGYPDRLALMPGGRCIWFELKSKGKRPSKVQMARFKQMADIGHFVNVCDSKESIDNILTSLGYAI